ncbi:hypothetical protein BHM03_00026047 [Ensete ventricosum]|nr:hypothetical protein BHM03_00026047 [Ensete ventricosum]
MREQFHYPLSLEAFVRRTHTRLPFSFFGLYPIPTTACGAVKKKKRQWFRRASYALESASSLVKGKRGVYGLLRRALLAAAKARGAHDSLFIPCCDGFSFLGVDISFHASLSISRHSLFATA